MALPQNWQTIAAYLISHGYTPVAAAGILGNIEQESGGDPESVGSGGGGLIGFTPLPAGYVTGHPAQDLQTQLAAIITYNNRQGQMYIAQLNRSRTPEQAAILYQNTFERPATATENQANRTGSARDVYNALVGSQGTGGFSPTDLLSTLYEGLTGSAYGDTSGVANTAVNVAQNAPNLMGDLERVGKYALAAGLVLVGVYFIGRRENVIPSPAAAITTAAKVAK
jgi:hypothetical protein